MIKIKETYIDGNTIIFKGEDDREYTLGHTVFGELYQCEIIMFEKEGDKKEVKPAHDYIYQPDGSVKCSKCGAVSDF